MSLPWQTCMFVSVFLEFTQFHSKTSLRNKNKYCLEYRSEVNYWLSRVFNVIEKACLGTTPYWALLVMVKCTSVSKDNKFKKKTICVLTHVTLFHLQWPLRFYRKNNKTIFHGMFFYILCAITKRFIKIIYK